MAAAVASWATVQDAPGEIQFAILSLQPKLAPRPILTIGLMALLGWKPTQ